MLSILYLRCPYAATPKYSSLDLRLSILYLRCHTPPPPPARRQRSAFNSLFEMRLYPKLPSGRGPGGLLSILYLRCKDVAACRRRSSGCQVLSILYLRCIAEGYIYQQQPGLGLSILYLRCGGGARQLHDYSLSSAFNSLFEMQTG